MSVRYTDAVFTISDALNHIRDLHEAYFARTEVSDHSRIHPEARQVARPWWTSGARLAIFRGAHALKTRCCEVNLNDLSA